VGALSGYLVLDVTDEKGMLCTKLLSDMGAEVTRFELKKGAARDRFRELIKNVDVFLETFPPGYLESLGLAYKDLSQINPGLVMVSITPFGQDGPYKDYAAGDLTLQALGGWLSVTGEPAAPLKLFGNQAYFTASLLAANGILLTLWQRQASGRGQYLDISIMECVAAALDHVLPRYIYEGVVSRRQGSLHWNNAFRVFTCKDGYILLSLHRHWETLVEWLESEGMAADLTDEKWRDRGERNRNIAHVIEVLENWTASHQVEELVEKGQLMRFPWAEVAISGRTDKQERKYG
jgi:benzylsuccinate CoA-transferase BbsE subunit